ncbi:hypothetical protein [Iningainema tapete]|uniref:hypothetical protein n=1 Tax=Iningainema tapete TaxID=2806730 RepID=UPI0030D86350
MVQAEKAFSLGAQSHNPRVTEAAIDPAYKLDALEALLYTRFLPMPDTGILIVLPHPVYHCLLNTQLYLVEQECSLNVIYFHPWVWVGVYFQLSTCDGERSLYAIVWQIRLWLYGGFKKSAYYLYCYLTCFKLLPSSIMREFSAIY